VIQKPKLIIIAGPNGSGKTTITNQILKHHWIEGCQYINPDNIAKDVYGDWNNSDNVLKAAKLATDKRLHCIENNESLIFETVLSSQEKIDFLIKAKQSGYFIRLFFIGTDSPTINASRVAKRVLEEGHDVPIQKIITRYYKSIANCSVVSSIVDRLYIYDNSIDDTKAKLLFRASNGVISKQYLAANDWAKPILASIQMSA
jgi:predicted ABC-type ATPase